MRLEQRLDCLTFHFILSRSLLGSILSSQTDPPTLENVDFTTGIFTFLKNQRFRSKDGFESVLGLSRAPFGSSWGSLGSSLGPLDRPKRASRFVLELSWASFARFLLPKMALGAFWGCLWLVLGAPKGLLKVVLASVKPISTIKTALPSFDTLFYLAVVVVLFLLLLLLLLLLLVLLVLVLVLVLLLVLVVVVAAVVVVVVFISLLPCNFSSTRLGGMRGAIE